jgi:hypothetical protein
MDETHGVVNEGVANTAISLKDEYAKSKTPLMVKVGSLSARSI